MYKSYLATTYSPSKHMQRYTRIQRFEGQLHMYNICQSHVFGGGGGGGGGNLGGNFDTDVRASFLKPTTIIYIQGLRKKMTYSYT